MSQTETKARVAPEAAPQAVADAETPKGTIAILVGYALVIIGLWGHMFLTMLQRGVK